MNTDLPNQSKWEMSDEDDEAMINESMMLMGYKKKMEASATKPGENQAADEQKPTETDKKAEE